MIYLYFDAAYSSCSGPCEPMRPPNQGWGFPPGPPMHHRNPVPSRPCEGSIPVAARGLFYLTDSY